MSKDPLEIFLFNSAEGKLASDSYSYLLTKTTGLSGELPKLKGHEINIVIADIETITKLNKEFRKVEGPTDVLAFPLKKSVEGEIWICPEKIRQNAENNDVSFEKELLRIVIHGLLHLAGYDHEKYFEEKEKQEEEMFQLQERILQKFYD